MDLHLNRERAPRIPPQTDPRVGLPGACGALFVCSGFVNYPTKDVVGIVAFLRGGADLYSVSNYGILDL